MTKINKKLVATYLALDNEKANAYLSKLGDTLRADIFASSDNGEIIEALDALKEFVYRVPKQTIEIATYLIGHPLEAKLTEIPGGAFYGKDYSDVMTLMIEILDRIRYIYPDGVLPILAELIRGEKQEFKNKATEVLKHFAKYDFNVLKTKVGYGAQRNVLDYVLKWTAAEQLENTDFIETIAHELLNSSVEGTSSGLNEEGQYTLTLRSGAVQPTDFLRKIRREVIDLIFDLYRRVDDEQKKIKLARVIEEAARGPMSVVYGDDLKQMLREDGEYLVSIYRKMLFDEKNHLIGSIAVAEEIEKRLFWFYRNSTVKSETSKKLRDAILADPFYSLFRLLAGDDVTFREEEGWSDAEKKRSDAIDALIGEIQEKNLKDWIKDLNLISAQSGLVADWQFQYFKTFLRRFSARKPDLAFAALIDAIKGRLPLQKFAAGIFDGLRDAHRLDLWDEAVEMVVASREPLTVPAVAYSLNIDHEVDLQKEIRDTDIEILSDIVNRAGQFSFLKNAEKNLTLEHAVLNALTRNFQRAPKSMENLIIESIKRYPEWRNFQVREVEFGAVKKWVDYSELSPEGIAFFKQWLIDIPNLDWEAENFLLSLGKKDLGIIMDIFWGRIEKDVEKKSDTTRILGFGESYRAIPYDINHELAKRISEDSGFDKAIAPWLEKVTTGWSSYNWNISHFLQQVGGIDSIIKSMVKRGDEKSLAQAVQLMDRFHGARDMALCMEIVEKTDNKKILSSLDAVLFSVGLVSGEDGLARAYEEKADLIRPYASSESGRVKKYAARLADSFIKSALQERQRTEEERRLRRIEFGE